MKKFILISILTISLFKAYSQFGYGQVNFDDTVGLFRIFIDTSIQNNIWQIGTPHKSFFSSSYSLPNAIITDTLNKYPTNNNSIFYYRTSGDFNSDAHITDLSFWYKMDCDTLTDFGRLEISLDTGNTWNNVLSNPNSYWIVTNSQGYYIIQSGNGDTIVFTGLSNGWYKFSYSEFLPEVIFDSIIFRFTFHSSAVSAFRDGWMIDDIGFDTWWESISELKKPCYVYPNPVKDQITINSDKVIVGYKILNSMGTVIMNQFNQRNSIVLNVADLTPGLYFYKIEFKSGCDDSGKFIKMN